MSNQIEEMLSELSGLEKQIEICEKQIYDEKQSLRINETYLNDVLKKEYYNLHAHLVEEKLKEEHLNWCTYCFKLFPEKSMSLFLITGVEHKTNEGHSWDIPIEEIHRVCPDCISRQLAYNVPFEDCRLINTRNFNRYRAERIDWSPEFSKRLPVLLPDSVIYGSTVSNTNELIDKFYKELFEREKML